LRSTQASPYLDNEPLEHVRRVPLYKERYIFVTSGGGRYDGRRAISWREAAGERLCLLSEDMQNRRIINAVFESLEIKPKPPVVSNSFLCVCSYLSAKVASPASCRILFSTCSPDRAI
jgi:DNA-binding transcriptional LysR family regulator